MFQVPILAVGSGLVISKVTDQIHDYYDQEMGSLALSAVKSINSLLTICCLYGICQCP